MSRPLVLCALSLVTACGGGATADVAGRNSKSISALQGDLEAMEARLAAVEAASADNATRMADVSAESAAAAAGVSDNAARIDEVNTRLDGHDVALTQESAVLLGLESRLFDPDYGEFPRVDAAIDGNTTAIATQAAELVALQGTVAGNGTAIGALGATVQGMEAVVDAASLQAQTNAADLVDLKGLVDGNAADLVALQAAVDGHDVAIVGLQQSWTDLSTAVDDLGLDVASNTTAIEINAADIASIQAGYLTAADLAPIEGDVAANSADIGQLQTDVAANDADLAQIRTNYLNDLDDLFTYLSTDTVTDELLLSGADLTVQGRVFSDTLALRECAGGRYSCTPKSCLALCQANGERMATTDEVLAWASAGNEQCAWAWMVDRNNPTVPVRAYPMFYNRTTSGCGLRNTGDIPRFGNGVVAGTDWDDSALYNCACSAD